MVSKLYNKNYIIRTYTLEFDVHKKDKEKLNLLEQNPNTEKNAEKTCTDKSKIQSMIPHPFISIHIYLYIHYTLSPRHDTLILLNGPHFTELDGIKMQLQ